MACNYFAIDVAQDAIRWAQVTPELEIGRSGTIEEPFADAEALVDALAALVAQQGEDIKCVCVSVAGTVSADDCQGTVIGDGRLSYLDGAALAAELSLACGLPVTVENDGKASALGEYARGALRGSHIGVVLVIGSGIGGGIVIDGHALRGAHDFAGEFSFIRHTPILGEMRTRDAMAGLCSFNGLRRSILTAKGMEDDESIDGHQLFEWINAGDDAALRGLHEYAKDLCIWIFNLQCIVDPDTIAIGGDISVEPAVLEALHISMRSMMADLQMPQVPKPNIVLAELGADARLVGAVSSAVER